MVFINDSLFVNTAGSLQKPGTSSLNLTDSNSVVPLAIEQVNIPVFGVDFSTNEPDQPVVDDPVKLTIGGKEQTVDLQANPAQQPLISVRTRYPGEIISGPDQRHLIMTQVGATRPVRIITFDPRSLTADAFSDAQNIELTVNAFSPEFEGAQSVGVNLTNGERRGHLTSIGNKKITYSVVINNKQAGAGGLPKQIVIGEDVTTKIQSIVDEGNKRTIVLGLTKRGDKGTITIITTTDFDPTKPEYLRAGLNPSGLTDFAK